MGIGREGLVELATSISILVEIVVGDGGLVVEFGIGLITTEPDRDKLQGFLGFSKLVVGGDRLVLVPEQAGRPTNLA